MGLLPLPGYAARMRVLRRRVRGFFALQSVLMLVSGGMKIAKANSMESISAASADGMTALMFAVRTDNVALTRLLCEGKASIGAYDHNVEVLAVSCASFDRANPPMRAARSVRPAPGMC